MFDVLLPCFAINEKNREVEVFHTFEVGVEEVPKVAPCTSRLIRGFHIAVDIIVADKSHTEPEVVEVVVAAYIAVDVVGR